MIAIPIASAAAVASATPRPEPVAVQRERVDIQDVKARLDIEAVVQNWSHQEINSSHKINCPFHGETTPSLHVYRETGTWFCWGCRKHGDALDFVGYLIYGDGYDPSSHIFDVIDAVGELRVSHVIAQRPRPAEREPAKLTALSMDDVERWHRTMPSERRAYWHSVGLDDAVINSFRLGWDGERYTIPVTYRGVVLGVKRRAAEGDSGPKYLMTKGSRAALFNADVLAVEERYPIEDTLWIVEGEKEAMLLTQVGLPAISSSSGAGTWKDAWTEMLWHVPNITVVYDNDDAGRSGALRVRASIRRARVGHWPDGFKDGGEFIPRAGIAATIQWLSQFGVIS